MGKFNNGIMGPVSGLIGPVIASSWKGVPYLKSRGKLRTKKAGERELATRQRFAIAQHWLRPITGFVRQGFKGYAGRVEGFIAAKSFLMKNAMKGEVIDPALMKVSVGTLPLPNDISVEKEDRFLRFRWDGKNSGGKMRDQVMMLAYDIENNGALWVVSGQLRYVGTDTLTVNTMPGRNYHVYMAFVSADRMQQSDSVYLGVVSY